MNDTEIQLQFGQAEATSNDSFTYVCAWLRHKDGTVSQHLFTLTELQRSAMRASHNPSLCFPLRVNDDNKIHHHEEEGA
jgi:hypothetical protein